MSLTVKERGPGVTGTDRGEKERVKEEDGGDEREGWSTENVREREGVEVC